MTTEQVDARQFLATALVTAIDHVGIAVADLDAAIAWYHDHLGMILVHEEVNEDQGIREAMLAVRGAPAGTAQIQLMAPIDDSSTIAKFLDKRGPGIQQMAFRVSDLDADRAASRPGRPADLRGPAARHRKLADQLHPSQGRRRSPHRARRAGRRKPGNQDRFRVGPRVSRLVQHVVCQCRRSSTSPPPEHRIGRPDHQMCGTGTDFVITAGATVGLDRAGRRDGTDFVLVAVGPVSTRRSTGGGDNVPLPTWRCATPSHAASLVGDDQNSRNSSLSMPRILS